MKKLICALLAALILCTLAAAEDIDLSGLSFQELAALRNRCLYEMMQRDEWQEVEVPAGIWEVGVDIPAGHWAFTVGQYDKGWFDVSIEYGDLLNADGSAIAYKSTFYRSHTFKPATPTFDLELTTGYLIVKYGTVIVTPYTGKPDLGFK